MKKFLIIAAVSFAACAGHAGVVTNFYANFQRASDGSIATAVDINAGTDIGSWNVASIEESYFSSNPAGNRRLALDQGQYDFTATLADPAVLENGVTFSIDFRNLRDGSDKYGDIRLKTAGGWNLLSLRLVPTANSTGNPDYLQIWDTESTAWVNVAEVFQNSPGIPNEVGMQTLQVVMSSSGFDVVLDGTTFLTDVAYDVVGTTLDTIRLSSPSDYAGVWYDEILVTQNFAPEGYASHFLADFNVEDSGGAGSLTNAAQLDAGTQVGSWLIADAQESLISNGAVGFDQGLYDVTANLASNASVKYGVVFDAYIRSRRDGSTKWNGIRIKNESGVNAVSLRWSGTVDGVSGDLQYWNGAWVSLSNNVLLANDFGFTSGLTDHLQVQMRETDYDVLLNGTNLLSNAAYINAPTSVGSVQLFGDEQYAGAWYDFIRVLKADAPDSITEIGSVSVGMSSVTNLAFSWDAEAMGTYVLQTRSDLLTGAWSNLVEGIEGIDGTLSVTTTPAAASSFYRIVGE